MNRTIGSGLAALALLATAAPLTTAPARAQSTATPHAGKAAVHDRAGLFSADAVKKADSILEATLARTHWQAVIETVDSLEGKTPEEAAFARAKALEVHGLYVLIAKKETKIQAEPSNTARKRGAFPRDRLNELVNAITKNFRTRDFDRGLLDAVELIRQDAEARPDTARPATATATAPPVSVARAEPPAPRPPAAPRTAPPAAGPVPAQAPATAPPLQAIGPVELLIGGAAVLFVLWLVSRIFRRPEPNVPPQAMTAGYGPQNAPAPRPAGYGPQGPAPVMPNRGYPPQQPGYGPQPGYPQQPGYGPQPGYDSPPQQGGGFMSGMLGGIGGAIAGNILYDKFGRPQEGHGHAHEAGGAGMPHPQSPDNPWPDAGAAAGGAALPPETYDPSAGVGGDWGGADPSQVADQGAQGDWGSPAPEANEAGMAGWSEPAPAPEPDQGAQGDWGASEPAPEPDAGAGGDWGAPEPDQGGGNANQGDW